MKFRITQINLTIFFIFFAIIGRLIPHPPNVTPLVSLSLFIGSRLNRWQAFIILLVSLCLSDVALHFLLHYPIFGGWTIFSYSGFAIIALMGSRIGTNSSKSKLLFYLLASSLGFWLWTNFGVWLQNILYPRTLTGLIECYTVALPFLRNSLCGDLIWMVIIFDGYKLVCEDILSSLNLSRRA